MDTSIEINNDDTLVSDDTPSIPFKVPRGWQRTFKVAYLRYPWMAVVIFLTGILATILEIASFATIILGVKLLSSDSKVSVIGYELEGPLSMTGIMIGVGVFAVLKLLSSLGYYGNMILVAKCRRRTYRNTIKETLDKVLNVPEHAYITQRGVRGLPRILRTESRYVSRAITDAMQLPRPILTLIALGIAGLYFYFIPVTIILVILLLSLPAHMLVARWGAKTMDTLLSSGAKKSQSDRRVFEDIFNSSFSSSTSKGDDIGRRHADSYVVTKFLKSYEDRMRLTAITKLLTNLTFIVIISALGGLMIYGLQVKAIDFAGITALFLGIRFAISSFEQIAKLVTVIVSYSPLISEFLDFLYDMKAKNDESNIQLVGAQYLTHKVYLITPNNINWYSSQSISKNWRKPKRPIQLIHGRFTEIPTDNLSADMAIAFQGPWASLSPVIVKKIKAAILNMEKASEEAIALIALWISTLDNPRADVFWDWRGFLRISVQDRELILDWIGKRRVIVHFSTPPKDILARDGYYVWVMKNQKIYKICPSADYEKHQSNILTFIANPDATEYRLKQ